MLPRATGGLPRGIQTFEEGTVRGGRLGSTLLTTGDRLLLLLLLVMLMQSR